MANSKTMSPYCKKDLTSLPPALRFSRHLSCFYLGQMFTRDFSLEQEGIDIMEKSFPCCYERKNSSDSRPTLRNEFCDFGNCGWKICSEHTSSVCFCFPASSELDEILPIIPLSIRFISSFRLSSFQCTPQSDMVNSHGSVHIHFFSFGSYTSVFFLVLFHWGQQEAGNGKTEEENVCATLHDDFCPFVSACLRSDYWHLSLFWFREVY